MDNLDKLSILTDQERCRQVLANPSEFEEALEVMGGVLDDRLIPPMAIWISKRLAETVRILHARLRTAKAEGAAETYESLARDMPAAPGLFMRRAAVIRKSMEAEEGK